MRIGASWIQNSGNRLPTAERHKLQASQLEPMPNSQPGRRRQRHPSELPSSFLDQGLYRVKV
jgi:hypothetical protein